MTAVGKFQVRTSGGDLIVKALVAGQTIKSVFLNGDFITSENAVFDLESHLRWHRADPSEIKRTITDSFKRNQNAWNKISAEDLIYAIDGAVKRSSPEFAKTIPNPCFARKHAEIS